VFAELVHALLQDGTASLSAYLSQAAPALWQAAAEPAAVSNAATAANIAAGSLALLSSSSSSSSSTPSAGAAGRKARLALSQALLQVLLQCCQHFKQDAKAQLQPQHALEVLQVGWQDPHLCTYCSMACLLCPLFNMQVHATPASCAAMRN
jgi:hypothetical protein